MGRIGGYPPAMVKPRSNKGEAGPNTGGKVSMMKRARGYQKHAPKGHERTGSSRHGSGGGGILKKRQGIG